MGILLDLIYALLLVVFSPVIIYKMIRYGRYRDGLGQRFGALPLRYGLQPVIWLHGVSLGEVNALAAIVRELQSQLPDYRLIISTSTDTGMAAARRLFAPTYSVIRWPLDFSLVVRRALGRARPDLVVLMEGDVWPNFLAGCNRRKIPVVVVNGRMSPDKGYPGYKKLGPLAAKLFNRLTAIGVQEEVYAECFRKLGTRSEKMHVTGMMKFDTIEVADNLPGQDELAGAMGITSADKLIVAGGTGPGEEKLLLDAFAKLRGEGKHPAARLAIVPRKPERFNEVAKLITGGGASVIRRSDQPDGSAADAPDDAIILGDTMGELRKFYALASCVFVGRSLVPMGGSDMIEAAALGKPTAFGPHTFNFPQADDLAENGCVRVADVDELVATLDKWLDAPSVADQAGKDAQQYVLSQQGATRRNVEMICGVLNRKPALAPGGIATDIIESAENN
ncbi:MAG: 3-deoxy-D-manno-octulosonic acid transferase [Phycisphaerales bacterium]|jgi:3-deoxy-D-manno-octulosonic-acid transferase|nr:3-deoxy-D-manno-octulosonic acid transferase [Phycisphaerales bacterium]